ncbi:MAG TPA: flagellin [Steroidobacteraceae bacterium]|nr:flagellin [Steroidobacteraceae bacterium]
MSLVLNTNIDSLVAQNSLTSSGSQLASALQQLSSGLRINTAADDAAGYAIAQGMTSQINGLNQAAQNANDGVSLAQTASGAMQEVVNDLQSMRDLAVESLNASNSSQDRTDLNSQFQQLMNDINSVSSQTQFNGVNLLDGSFQGATFQVGANAGQSITIGAISSASASAVGNYYNGTASVANETVTLASGSTVAGPTAAATAGAYSAANLSGTADLNTAVDGASVTLSVTVDGTAYTTNAVTLTGTASTDLKSVAAAINQSLSSAGGIVATVNSAGTGISLSGTAAAGAGHLVNFSVASATDASGNSLTLSGAQKTAITTDLGVDSSDTVGSYKTGTGTTTSSSVQYLSGLNVKTVDNSNLTLISIDNALQQLATSSADLGAYQNRFQAAITGLNTDSTNLSAAKSSIVDADYAQATSNLSKAQILQQASTAMVAQANTIPQNILTLLQKLP